ncbi:MAG TPA: zinc-binding dehydrogenase [Puia sp.]|nr:zinc-binding dehydrogenase [Puia sp.]
MKALVLTEKGRGPEWKDVPDRRPGQGEVVVRVHAAALNHRDVWIQKGQYAGLKYPIVPGSDGAGVVMPGPDAGAWAEKEVIINPALQWGNHSAYQDPADFRILGLPDDGTLGEYVCVPVENLVAKPAHLSFEEAAALPLAGVTAYRALMTRAQVRRGETVLITGIGGGVALFALQFAVAAGAKVYVSSGSDEKIDRAMSLGATGGANYKNAGLVEALRSLSGGGFDVVIDGAAGDGLNDLLDVMSPGGRLAIYGATRGNVSNVVARRIFWKQLNILGSTMGSPEDFAAMVALVDQHKIKPVVDQVFAAADGAAAFQRMDEGLQFGKIVVKMR